MTLRNGSTSVEWTNPLPNIKITYSTNIDDYDRPAFPLEYRGTDLYTAGFYNVISDLRFLDFIDICITFGANTINYVGGRVAAEQKRCLKFRAS